MLTADPVPVLDETARQVAQQSYAVNSIKEENTDHLTSLQQRRQRRTGELEHTNTDILAQIQEQQKESHMATLQDVTAELTLKTEKDAISWHPGFTIFADGTVTMWQTTVTDCTFRLQTNSLSADYTELGPGPEIKVLFDLVSAKYQPKRTPKDEALSKALDCLVD